MTSTFRKTARCRVAKDSLLVRLRPDETTRHQPLTFSTTRGTFWCHRNALSTRSGKGRERSSLADAQKTPTDRELLTPSSSSASPRASQKPASEFAFQFNFHLTEHDFGHFRIFMVAADRSPQIGRQTQMLSVTTAAPTAWQHKPRCGLHDHLTILAIDCPQRGQMPSTGPESVRATRADRSLARRTRDLAITAVRPSRTDDTADAVRLDTVRVDTVSPRE